MIYKIHHGLSKWEKILMYVGCVAIVIAMLLTTVDVLLRNTIGKALVGSTELVSLLLMPIFTGALPYVQSKSSHIILEFATDKVPEKVKYTLDSLGCAVGAFIFIACAKKCVTEAIRSLVRMDTIMGAVQLVIWPVKFMLAIVVLTLIVRLVVDIGRNICRICGKEDPCEKEEK